MREIAVNLLCGKQGIRPKALLLDGIGAARLLEADGVRTLADAAAMPLFRRLTREFN